MSSKEYFLHAVTRQLKLAACILILLLPGSVKAASDFWTTAPLSITEGLNRHYVHADHLGTPKKLSNKNGAVSWSAHYGTYGASSIAANGITNNLRFPGQYYDSESGLYHNFQRNYDPALGAYLAQDPMGVLLTGPNRYWYSAGNPVNLSDPTGELPVLVPIVWGVIAVGSAIGTGFELFQCIEEFRDYCAYSSPFEHCVNSIVTAALSFFTGGAYSNAKIAWQATRQLRKILEVQRRLPLRGVETFEKKWKGKWTKQFIERKTPGADGASSRHIIEKLEGKTISKTHQVTKGGRVIHQHQTHIGKYGTNRQFPDEWVDYPQVPGGGQ